VHERFFGLVGGDQFRSAQLSRLVDKVIVDDFCEELGFAVGASREQLNGCLRGGYQYSLQTVMVDDQPMVEIAMSQNLQTNDFLDPPDDVPNLRVQGSMTIRVPFSELDNGHPENFIVVKKPHMEIRQDD
jgi:hypothetical protein